MERFLIFALLTAGVLAGEQQYTTDLNKVYVHAGLVDSAKSYVYRLGDSTRVNTKPHLYAPGEPRPVSFSVHCDTTYWIYPVEYEAIIKCTTVDGKWVWMPDSCDAWGNPYPGDSTLLFLQYPKPIIHCDTLGYRRVK
jgi:hypothetical protein